MKRSLQTISQVHLNPEKHGENLAGDTTQLLAQLDQSGGEVDLSVLEEAE